MASQVDPNSNARVDAYIEKAQPFARPILRKIREMVHAHHPEIGEAIKWGMPMFTYRGKNLCHMAAFKAHAAFGFGRREGTEKREAEARGDAPEGMGQFGKLTSVDELPPQATIAELMDEGMALIDGAAKTRAAPEKRPPRAIVSEAPPTLAAALAANSKARATYDAFPPGARRDYDEWIAEAKRDDTRAKRVLQAVEWLAEGKKRHWKYETW